MDGLSLTWFAVGWGLAGFVNGVTGFGAAMVAMPFALYAMDLQVAVPACSLMALIASLEQWVRYRDFTDWKHIGPVAAGAVPGAFFGVLALRFLPAQYLKGALGVFLLGYVVWEFLLKDEKPKIIGKAWGYGAGFLATALGTALSISGPPFAVYAALSGWNKNTCKAGLAVFFLIASSLMVGAQALAGLHSTHTLAAAAVGTPCCIAGAFLGLRTTRRMGDDLYRRLLLFFIGLSGAIFMAQALRAL